MRSSCAPKYRSSTLLLALFVVLGLTGCLMPDALIVQSPDALPQPPPAPQSARETINPHLEAALAHTPAGTGYVAFTNWTRLKQIAGVGDLTNEDSIEFLLPHVLEKQALASHYAGSYSLDHAENWGWDATDLLWEAKLSLAGPPIYLLRFRDDFDFAPVFARLDERGYSVTEHAGATVYSHAMDLSQGWLHTSEFAVLNIAFLEEEKLFILAPTPDIVTAILNSIARGLTWASLPAVRAVAAELGDVGAAILSPLGCQLFDVTSSQRDSLAGHEAFMETMRQSGISGLYTVFGLGYRVEMAQEGGEGKSVPLGVFVYHYPIAAQAHADLMPRRLLAETGTRLATDSPYAELFEVIDAQVVETGAGGANLVLLLHTLERPPHLFIQMFDQRDLLFSACSG